MPAQRGAMVTFPREPANSPADLYLMLSLVPQDSDFELKAPPPLPPKSRAIGMDTCPIMAIPPRDPLCPSHCAVIDAGLCTRLAPHTAYYWLPLPAPC